MKLTIVIPSYNVESYICKTLNSLINQSNKDFELIVVDDGSTDGTYTIAHKRLSESPLTDYKIIRKKNGGVSSARNTGLQEARGEYILFLDGDDYVSEDMVDTIYECLREHAPEIVCWGYNIVKENQETITNYFKKYKSDLDNLTGVDTLNKILIDRAMWIWTGSAAYSTQYLKKYNLKYTEGCSNGEDQEFTYKALARAEKVKFIKQTLSYYVHREGSISNSYNIRKFDAINAMERTCEYIESVSDDKLKKVANVIKNDNVIGNFMQNFNSCLTFQLKNNVSKKEALTHTYSDLEKNFPGMNDIILNKMEGFRGNSKSLSIRINTFLYSPIMYYWLIKLTNKLNSMRRG